MKTHLTVLSFLGLAACQQTASPPPTRLSGTNSSVVSGSLLFITSSRSNEVRILDLEPQPGKPRDFVRAPNPLAPLSIPTLPSPVELATPTRYGPMGQPRQGDWVFARGAGSPSVSIIGAVNCAQQLREFGRVTPRPDSVVTALASRLTTDDRVAQLYFTTFDGNDSTLWELLLPNLPRDRTSTVVDPKLCGPYPGALTAYSLQPLGLLNGEVVTAMVALPTVEHPGATPDPEERRLVLATRVLAQPPALPGTMTELGRMKVVDPSPSGLLLDPTEAVFNSNTTIAESFPIKRLVTHGNVVNLIPAGDGGITLDADGGVTGGTADVVMDAGTRIFAVLDEASCAGTIDCVGVLAVDLDRVGTVQATSLDGGTAPVSRYPVAIDGFDNKFDQVDDAGTRFPVTDGGAGFIQFADTFYRPPATFPDGGPRNTNRMLPVRFGNDQLVGIIQDVVVQSAGWVLYLGSTELQYGLLGHVTITGYGNSIPAAQIYAFDGMTLRQINFAGADPGVTTQQAVLNAERNGGSPATFRGGPQEIKIEGGIWPYSETVYVLYEGVVAGVAREPLDAGLGNPRAGIWPISINSRTVVEQGYVEPGDIIVPVDSTNTECQYAFPLLAAAPDGGLLVPGQDGVFLVTRLTALASDLDGGSVLVFPDGTSPTIESCPPPVSYRVRSSALAAHPFTVTGFASGFLGRIAPPAPGAPLPTVFQAGEDTQPRFVRFWRPSLDAGTSATQLSRIGLGFKLYDQLTYVENGTIVTDAGVEPVLRGGDEFGLRGSGYSFGFLNGYTPASVPVSSSSLGVSGLGLPGALALYQRQFYPTSTSPGSDRIFVLYPGGNVILDFSPTTVTYSVPNVTQDIGIHF